MIRAVLFDVGGPLNTEVAFEAAIDADLRAGLEHEGFSIDDETWAAANDWAVEAFAPRLYRSLVWRLTNGDRAASDRIDAWMETRSSERNLFELRDGIDDVLGAIHSRSIKLGLAANQPAGVIQQLDQFGIGHFFGSQAISGVYGYRKPDLRLFLRACDDLGVQPEECIMVGDRIDIDVVPAKTLGMRTVRIITGRHRNQKPRSWDEIPDLEVDDSAGILRAIETLITRNAG